MEVRIGSVEVPNNTGKNDTLSSPPFSSTVAPTISAAVAQGVDKDYLETLKDAHPGLILIHPQRLLDRKELYADRLHTNGVGTATLSRFIGEVIRRLEAGEDYTDLLAAEVAAL